MPDLPPLRELPSFNRRPLLRPGSNTYERSELGEQPRPAAHTALNAPKVTNEGVDGKWQRADPPAKPRPANPRDTNLPLPIPSYKAKANPYLRKPQRHRWLLEPTTAGVEGNGQDANTHEPAAFSLPGIASVAGGNEHKIAQLHRRPKFKQIVKPAQSELEKAKELVNGEFTGEAPADEPHDDATANRTQKLEIPGLVPRLLAHQVVGVNFMTRRENSKRHERGGILADLMGLGKTLQSIALMLHNRGSEPTLVVVPLTVMDQWKDEIRRMAPGLRVMTHQGPARATEVHAFKDHDVVVTTYNVVTSDFACDGVLFQRKWFRIIADEAHAFRNPKTKLAHGMLALRSDGRRWALTGTPIHNSVDDIITLLRFIGVSSALTDNLTELRRLLRSVMLRRTQKVLKGALPGIQMEKKGVELNGFQKTVYAVFADKLRGGDQMQALSALRLTCDGIVTESGHKLGSVPAASPKSSASSPTSSALNPGASNPFDDSGEIDESDALAAMLGGMSLKPEAETAEYWGHDNAKVQAVREVLLEERGRQTVVFSSFVTMLHALEPMLAHEGISYELYHGSMTANKRQDVLTKFRAPSAATSVLLCSLHAAAIGLNLANASQVVLVEPWWNPQISDQAIKRVHRLGQTREVRCVEVYARGTIEERILYIQTRKRRQAHDMLHEAEKLSKEERHFIMFGDVSEEGAVDVAGATDATEGATERKDGKKEVKKEMKKESKKDVKKEVKEEVKKESKEKHREQLTGKTPEKKGSKETARKTAEESARKSADAAELIAKMSIN